LSECKKVFGIIFIVSGAYAAYILIAGLIGVFMLHQVPFGSHLYQAEKTVVNAILFIYFIVAFALISSGIALMDDSGKNNHNMTESQGYWGGDESPYPADLETNTRRYSLGAEWILRERDPTNAWEDKSNEVSTEEDRIKEGKEIINELKKYGYSCLWSSRFQRHGHWSGSDL
jgi:hypothetical protein